MESNKTLSNEEICDFYVNLLGRMTNYEQFCCLPMPAFVSSDPRLADVFKKHARPGIYTCPAQVEYHKKMEEDPANAKSHYIEYALKLGIEIDEIADFTGMEKTRILTEFGEQVEKKDEIA